METEYNAGLAALVRENKLRALSRPLTTTHASYFTKPDHAALFARAQGIEARYRRAIENGLLPKRAREAAIRELEQIKQEAAEYNRTLAATWSKAREELRKKYDHERQDVQKRILELREAEIRIGAMDEIERGALAAEFLAGRKHLRSHEIDMLCLRLREGADVRRELRDRRKAYAADPALEYPEATTYQDLERRFLNAGSSLEFERADRPAETTFISLDQLIDLSE